MKTTALLLVLSLLTATAGYSQIIVRDVVPVEFDKIQYPNNVGKTFSSGNFKGLLKLTDGSTLNGKLTFFKKDEKLVRVKVNTGEEKKEVEASQIASIHLDPNIYEKKHPNNYKNIEKNFQEGYIMLPNGVQLNGKVAQNKDLGDYDFFIYSVLFLPEGTSVASVFRSGKLAEFGQTMNGKLQIWDGYADGFLLRIVDGRYRVSRNPYSTTKNEFFTSVINHAGDSLAKQVAQKALQKSFESGKNINESIENAANTSQAVSEVFGGIEISKKEYLIFDTKANTVKTVNKDSYKEYARSLTFVCPEQFQSATNPKELLDWNMIEDFFRLVNEKCTD